MSEILHATLVADRQDGRWRGVLIRGASGSGKSTLALRCLDTGFRLVADDRVVVWRSGHNAYGKAPAPLTGLMEVRGVGVVASPATLRLCEIALVVELAPAAERMPDPSILTIAGVTVPQLALLADAPHAPLRLRAALAAVRHAL